jgi:hypothetical protein
MFLYCNYIIMLMKVCWCLESVSTYFVVDELILLFVALVEILGPRTLLFLFIKISVICE